MLNISDSWLEMSFLSNCNILVWILLRPTDLLEPDEDMIFSISVFPVGLIKKEVFNLFLRKSEKCLCENEILKLVSAIFYQIFIFSPNYSPLKTEIVFYFI